VRLARDYRQNIRRVIQAAEEADIPLLLGTLPINRLYVGRADSAPIDEVTVKYGSLDPCVEEAISLMNRVGNLDEVVTALEQCDDDLPDALRWRGIVLWKAGRYDEARAALDQSIELQPRNRCRPSFNEIVREEAAASANTTLVDLDAAASEMFGSHGIVGEEQFLDYCHMNWRGYAGMAAAVLEGLEQAGALPDGGARPSEALELEELARRHGLNRVRFVED